METEFYKSIPHEIREKLQEYVELYSNGGWLSLKRRDSLINSFVWNRTPENDFFWEKYYHNNTFPIWSAELNRFIDPPTPIDIIENPNKFYPL